MASQCLFASVISNNSRNICCSQSGAIRVYSVWHAWALLRSAGWRGTTLDLSPAGKLSCEQFFSCEMDSLLGTQQTCARMTREDRCAFKIPEKSRAKRGLRMGPRFLFAFPFPVAATVPGSVRERVPRRTRARLLLMQGWDCEKTLGGLWTPALLCGAPWVGTHSGVLCNQAAAAQQWAAPTPWPKTQRSDGACRLRPGTPFLPQMYCRDSVVQQLQSLTWLFLMAWLFDVAVFFFYFWGEKILSSNHTYLIAAIGATLNGPCLSSVMVMIRRLYLQWEV